MKMNLRKFADWNDFFRYIAFFGVMFIVLSMIFLVGRSIYLWIQTDNNYEEVQKYVSDFQSWTLTNDISYSDIKESVCRNPKVKSMVSSNQYVDKETCLNRTKVLLNCNPETKEVSLWWDQDNFVPSPYNPLTYENTLSLALSVKSSEEADKVVSQCQSLINKKETAPTNVPVEQFPVDQNTTN